MSTDQPSRMKASIPDGASASLAGGGNLSYVPEPNLPVAGSSLGAVSQGLQQFGANVAQFGLAIAAQRQENKDREDMVEANTLVNNYQVELAEATRAFQQEYVKANRPTEEYSNSYRQEVLTPLEQRYKEMGQKFSKVVGGRYSTQLGELQTRGTLGSFVDQQGLTTADVLKRRADSQASRLAKINASPDPGTLNDSIQQLNEETEAVRPIFAGDPTNLAKLEADKLTRTRELGVSYIEGIVRAGDFEQAVAMVEDEKTIYRLALTTEDISRVYSKVATATKGYLADLNTKADTVLDSAATSFANGNFSGGMEYLQQVLSMGKDAQKFGGELKGLVKAQSMVDVAQVMKPFLDDPSSFSAAELDRLEIQLNERYAGEKNPTEHIAAVAMFFSSIRDQQKIRNQDPVTAAGGDIAAAIRNQQNSQLPMEQWSVLTAEQSTKALALLTDPLLQGGPKDISKASGLLEQALSMVPEGRIPGTSITYADAMLNQMYRGASEPQKKILTAYVMRMKYGATDPDTVQKAFLAATMTDDTRKNLLSRHNIPDYTLDKFRADMLKQFPALALKYQTIPLREGISAYEREKLAKEFDIVLNSMLLSASPDAGNRDLNNNKVIALYAPGKFISPGTSADLPTKLGGTSGSIKSYVKQGLASIAAGVQEGLAQPLAEERVAGGIQQAFSAEAKKLASRSRNPVGDAVVRGLTLGVPDAVVGLSEFVKGAASVKAAELPEETQITLVASRSFVSKEGINLPPNTNLNKVKADGTLAVYNAVKRGDLAIIGKTDAARTLSPQDTDRMIKGYVFQNEGKDKYIANDAGQGPTKWGINFGKQREVLAAVGITDLNQFKNMTKQQADTAYNLIMSRAPGLSNIADPKLKALMADAYFNSPVSYQKMRAALAGKDTSLSPANPANFAKLDEMFELAKSARIAYLKNAKYQEGSKVGQSQWKDFGAGWTARIDKITSDGAKLRGQLYPNIKPQLQVQNAAVWRDLVRTGISFRNTNDQKGVEFGMITKDDKFVPFYDNRTNKPIRLFYAK